MSASSAQPASPQASIARPGTRLRKEFFVSTFVIVLTVLVGTVCIFALASTLTQSRILSLSFDGVPASIWKLDSVRQDWSALRKQIADQTEALKAANSANLMLEDRGTKAAQGLNWAKEQLKDTLYEVSASLSGIDNDLSDFLSGSADYGAKVARLKASNARLRNGQASLAGVLDQFDKISGAYAIAKTEYDEYDAESKGLNQKITSLASGIKSIQDSIDVVFSKITKNVDAPTRARIENALYELNPTSTWFSKAISWFVILQPDVLSLILVVLMGVLGSSMQILHSLFRGDGIQSFGDYVLRLSVGAITALVIFIVAKAGVPIIADASRLNGDAPINPYFVSFVAIISGLMSEQAIVTVQNQGQRFFANGTSEPDRWARQDLNPDLAAQNLDVPTLARYLTISNEAAEAILKGSQRATSEQQKIVAIYLRKSVRDLFSDLPQR